MKDTIVSCYNSKGLCVYQCVLTDCEDLSFVFQKIKETIGEHRHGYRDIHVNEVTEALDIFEVRVS